MRKLIAMLPPGLAHALLGLAIMAVVTAAFLLAGAGRWGVWAGASAAAWFYIGRERRQTEEWAGSNLVPPWVWRPRALRDAGWPALAALAAAALLTIWRL